MSDSTKHFVEDLIGQEFVVFAGTGIVAEGVPKSWEALLCELAKEADCRIDLKCISKDQYPDEAQKIFEHLIQKGKKEKYYEIIKNALALKDSSWDNKAFDILDTTKTVVTTNFDGTFEATYKRLVEKSSFSTNKPYTESLPSFTHSIDYNRHKITYLHGRADEKHIIFKKDDYETYYPSLFGVNDGDNCLEGYLQFLFTQTILVFIGFSFEDNYVLQAFQKIYAQLEKRDLRCEDKIGYEPIIPRIRHYAFLPSRNPNNSNYKQQVSLDENLKKIGISVIYLDQKRDWQDYFGEIRNLKRLKHKHVKNVSDYVDGNNITEGS